MYTQAHILFNYFAIKQKNHKFWPWIIAGALVPDSPMFVFYFIEKFIIGSSEKLIWSERYFLDGWQDFIDCFNSLPIAMVLLLIFYFLKKKYLILFAVSMILHLLMDLPLHHDDAHRHFFPLLDYRFESPVSYWDPRHYGVYFSSFEGVSYLLIGGFMWKNIKSMISKGFIVFGGLVYILIPIYYLIMTV